MSLTVTISDEILGTIKFPREQIESELTKEIAFTLYARGMLSMGAARRLANMNKWSFIEGLAERGITRHYYDSEADEDISYARSCK